MDFDMFKLQIADTIRTKLGEDYTVKVFRVTKNNGLVLDNLAITEGDTAISPCIYLQYYYARFQEGRSVDQVAEDMIAYYRRSLPSYFDQESFFDSRNLRSHLVCRLINTDRNKALLQECPHLDFLNLSVIFYLLFDQEAIGAGAIVLRYEHLKPLRIREEDLLALAFQNMKTLLPAEFLPIDQMIRDLKEEGRRRGEAGGKDSEEDQEEGAKDQEESTEDQETGRGDQEEDPREREKGSEGREEGLAEVEKEDWQSRETDLGSRIPERRSPLYVLTNVRRSFGAAWIMDPGLLRKISQDLKDDFYILPSSIHECMILPASLRRDPHYLAEIVEEINRTQVAPEEILADSVYLYSRKAACLKIAA